MRIAGHPGRGKLKAQQSVAAGMKARAINQMICTPLA
jgi:hypothetical protein